MDNVTRIGVSLEPELLKDFDQLIETKGYSSRSEAIRDMIRNALIDSILEDEDAEVVGTVTLIYEHHKGSVQENLMEIQHQHHANISSTIHIHLSLEHCLEILVVWGKVREVKTIADALMSVRGVLHGKLTMTSGRVDSHPPNIEEP